MPIGPSIADMTSQGDGLGPETIARVHMLPLFAALDRQGIAALLDGSSLLSLTREDILFRQGEAADSFYIVLAGRIALQVTDNAARESVIEVVKPGDTFGEEAIFDRGRFPFGARAVEHSKVVRVPAEPFLKTLAADFKFVALMMASMSAHLRCLVKQVGELKLKTTEQRLGSYLLALLPAETGAATVTLPCDKKILASQLGMTPESFSRALAKLRTVGVRASNSTVAVDDVAELRSFCQEMDLSE